ncbi:MAG: hypothetical protein D6E12_15275 [Desulfovibrio sp.]|nr:MAG: hypothetical protein D6E12_15275 [Desulfovibrio sp.]
MPHFILHRMVLPSMLVLCLILLWTSPALAHRVNIFAWVEGQTIHTESSFVNGTPVSGGTVRVQEAGTGHELLSGTTDETGMFSFTVPQEALDAGLDLTLIIEAGQGHQAQWPVQAEEYTGTSSLDQEASLAESSQAPLPEADESAGRASAQADLETVIDQALSRHLAPIKRDLAAMQDQGPGVTEIIGGIGWFVGLAGIAAYFRSKRSS